MQHQTYILRIAPGGAVYVNATHPTAEGIADVMMLILRPIMSLSSMVARPPAAAPKE